MLECEARTFSRTGCFPTCQWNRGCLRTTRSASCKKRGHPQILNPKNLAVAGNARNPQILNPKNLAAGAPRNRFSRGFDELGGPEPTHPGARGAERAACRRSVGERARHAYVAEPALSNLGSLGEQRTLAANHAAEPLIGFDGTHAVGPLTGIQTEAFEDGRWLAGDSPTFGRVPLAAGGVDQLNVIGDGERGYGKAANAQEDRRICAVLASGGEGQGGPTFSPATRPAAAAQVSSRAWRVAGRRWRSR